MIVIVIEKGTIFIERLMQDLMKLNSLIWIVGIMEIVIFFYALYIFYTCYFVCINYLITKHEKILKVKMLTGKILFEWCTCVQYTYLCMFIYMIFIYKYSVII